MENVVLLKKLGHRIRELRKLKNISQMELAYSIDMSMNTISYIELGKTAAKIDTLNKIAQRLGVEIDDLFDFFEVPQTNKIVRKKVEEISHKMIECDQELISTISQMVTLMIKHNQPCLASKSRKKNTVQKPNEKALKNIS